MKKIQMVDLKGQMQEIKPQIKQSFDEILDSCGFIGGPHITRFQDNLASYLGVKHVIGCANGTDALQISLMSLGLQPGDEVITADFTFAATVEAIALLRLTPVLVDVSSEDFNISIAAIEKSITPKTKAIIPVHLFGKSADMEPILALAKKHNLYVIEDNAQAIGASYKFSDGSLKKTGTMGDIATTSFFPSKNLGAYGDGGAIFTNDDKLAYKIKGIVNHGMYKRYYHSEVGVNSRLDALQAAVLNAKLPHLDSYNAKRRNAAKKYQALLTGVAGIELPMTLNSCSEFSCDNCQCHVFHQFTLRIKNNKRDALATYLSSKNIPFGIYYPIPLHKQEAYASESYSDTDFPVTNALSNEVISLPMHTELKEDQIHYICNAIKDFLKS